MAEVCGADLTFFLNIRNADLESAPEEPKYEICKDCGVKCFEDRFELVCPQCGYSRPWESDTSDLYCKSIEQNHNTWNNQYFTFNIVGKDVRGLRACLKLYNSSYYAYRDQLWRSRLEEKLKAYKGVPVPDAVVVTTLHYFKMIKDAEIIYRSKGAWYIMGACMVNAFSENGIPRKRQDICDIMGIEKTDLSLGENQIVKLNSHGVIDINITSLPYETYINSYLEQLDIAETYADFAIDVINMAEHRYVHIRSETWPITKCVGAIHFLCQCTELRYKVSKEDISTKCQISQSTFMRYYNLLVENAHLLRPIFHKYRVAYRREWLPATTRKLDELRKPKPPAPYVYAKLGYRY